jgi:hypothetical protein
MQEIERAITDFVHLHHQVLDSRLPPIAGPRALLRARLTAPTAKPERSFGSHVVELFAMCGSHKFICAAALVCAIVVMTLTKFVWPSDPGESRRLEIAAIPKPQLTPGATVPVTKQQVCGSSSLTQGPVVPTSVQQQVFAAYGISQPKSGAYEIDYLVTPDLGGTADIRNLWPQPFSNTVWNARVKDQLEERLHSMVCTGEIDVATAQHDLAADWVSAYKKYFHTDRPHLGHTKARKRIRQGVSPEDDSPAVEPVRFVPRPEPNWASDVCPDPVGS